MTSVPSSALIMSCPPPSNAREFVVPPRRVKVWNAFSMYSPSASATKMPTSMSSLPLPISRFKSPELWESRAILPSPVSKTSVPVPRMSACDPRSRSPQIMYPIVLLAFNVIVELAVNPPPALVCPVKKTSSPASLGTTGFVQFDPVFQSPPPAGPHRLVLTCASAPPARHPMMASSPHLAHENLKRPRATTTRASSAC